MARKIQIDLEAGTAQFISGTDKAADALERFRHHGEEAKGFLDRFKEGLELAGGIVAMEKGLELAHEGLEKLKESFESVGRIGRDALKLGVSVEDMSRFEHAATAAHVGSEALTTGIDHLNRELGKVVSGDQGAKAAAAALDKLGLSAVELSAMNPADSFRMVSEALAHTSSTYERAAITQDLFGRGGRELLPVMEHLTESMKESDEIGFTRTEADVKRVEEAERSLAAATDALKGAFMQLASSEIVTGFLKKVASAISDVRIAIGGIASDVAGAQQKAFDVQRERAAHEAGHSGGSESAEWMQKELELLEKEKKATEELIQQRMNAHIAIKAEVQHLYAINQLIEQQKTSTEKAVHELHTVDTAYDEQQKAAAKVWDEWQRGVERANKSVDELIEKSKQLGHTKEENLEKQLRAAGLSDDRVKAGVDAQRKIDEYDKQQERLRRAAELYHDAETPLERYNDRMKELNDLLQHGALSHQQYAEAADKAKKDLEKSTKGIDPTKHPTDKDHLAENVTRRFTFDLPGKQRDAADQSLQLQKQNTQIFQQWNQWFQQMWNQAVNNVGGATNSDIAAAFA